MQRSLAQALLADKEGSLIGHKPLVTVSRSRSTYSHGDAAQADIRTQPFSDPGRAPEHARYAGSELVMSLLRTVPDSLLARR